MMNDERLRRDADGGRGGTTHAYADHHLNGPIARPGRTSNRHGRRWLLGGVAAVAAICVVTWGITERNDNLALLTVEADTSALPKVTLVSPTRGPSSRTLTLPGETQAWYQAPIFAQVTGYVEMWYKDYGATVKKGDLLATIATPNLDQELQQARAELAVARSKASLAQVTAARWQKLAGTQAVSQEAVDVNNADAKSAQSAVQAAQFNVARYEAQEDFKRVVAPFDGVVTSRQTDIGNFVNAAGATAQQSGKIQELFTVADIHEIRIFVSVPQDYSAYIKPGLSADVMMPQFPNQVFKADFVTTAKSFNPDARTVVTELTIPNPDQKIWPGAYADVKFAVPADQNILVIPEEALLFRSKGLQVAVVGSDDRVHLQNVVLGLNFGDTVQVTSGLKLTDRIIANPSDGLLEGQKVQVIHPPSENTDTPPAPSERRQSFSSR